MWIPLDMICVSTQVTLLAFYFYLILIMTHKSTKKKWYIANDQQTVASITTIITVIIREVYFEFWRLVQMLFISKKNPTSSFRNPVYRHMSDIKIHMTCTWNLCLIKLWFLFKFSFMLLYYTGMVTTTKSLLFTLYQLI